MRVALYFPDGAVASYKLGRIVDGAHTTDILTGQTTSVQELAEALAEQAKAEYPQCQVKIEKWVDNGDETSQFVPIEPDEVIETVPSNVEEVELSLTQGSDTEVNI
jgi:hypothetical protein